MLIALYKNARTTPAVRAEIAAGHGPASVLAQRFGITERTVYKWKKREVFGDRSHTAHHLQTVLTPAQETVVVHPRRTLLLPRDEQPRYGFTDWANPTSGDWLRLMMLRAVSSLTCVRRRGAANSTLSSGCQPSSSA